jgi:hypothetical protein
VALFIHGGAHASPQIERTSKRKKKRPNKIRALRRAAMPACCHTVLLGGAILPKNLLKKWLRIRYKQQAFYTAPINAGG